MNIRFVLAVIIAAVVMFILGWLVFGFLLANFYASQMTAGANALMKNPPTLWAIFLSNFVWALLLTIIFDRYAYIYTVARGAVAGALIIFLMVFGFDLLMFGTMKMYEAQFALIDAIFNGIFGLIPGALIGFILGYKRTAAEG